MTHSTPILHRPADRSATIERLVETTAAVLRPLLREPIDLGELAQLPQRLQAWQIAVARLDLPRAEWTRAERIAEFVRDNHRELPLCAAVEFRRVAVHLRNAAHTTHGVRQPCVLTRPHSAVAHHNTAAIVGVL